MSWGPGAVDAPAENRLRERKGQRLRSGVGWERASRAARGAGKNLARRRRQDPERFSPGVAPSDHLSF